MSPVPEPTHRRGPERPRSRDAVEILDYEPELAPHFASINYEWLRRLFAVEDIDREFLDDPHGRLIARGGQVLFARVDGVVCGTCALDRQGDRFELMKMGVLPAFQGRGIGRRLLDAALERARACGVRAVFLVTNSELVTALTLYREAGFRVIRSGSHPKYARGDLTMELEL